MSEKQRAYAALVQKRKSDRFGNQYGFKNQVEVGFEKDEIGNYSTWANDLDADLLVVAQDYADVETYKRDEGQVQRREFEDPENIGQWDTPSNYFLWKLLHSIGRNIGLPNSPIRAGVFLTNAVLDLKPDSMSQAVRQAMYHHSGEKFLKPLIDIIQPKFVVALGVGASRALLSLYKESNPENTLYKNKSMQAIFRHGPFTLVSGKTMLYPVYHPGRLGQIGRKRIEQNGKSGLELMVGDWKSLTKNF
jgi:hypothetical protein